MNTESVIQIDNLEKKYPNEKMAVDDLSLSIQRGEIFGILGPNGAGKTTTILMLLGLTEPSGGRVSVLGLDPLRSPLEVKQKVGYMPDTVGFYDELSGWDNLEYTARLQNIPTIERRERIRQGVEKMGLSDTINQKVGTYSHGMRRRLGLSEILVKQPEIAILDEPTQGLDPESANEFLELIGTLNRDENLTILLSSHLLDQVQAVCDRVGLFSSGKLLIEGTVPELASKVFGGRFLVTLQAEGGKIKKVLSGLQGVNDIHESGPGRYRVECKTDIRPQIAETVVASGGEIFEMTMKSHTLNSIYQTYFQEVVHET